MEMLKILVRLKTQTILRQSQSLQRSAKTKKNGMKGNGCSFHHPKRCAKLMSYGTKTNKGCNLGNKCPDFHPKMCPMSISKSEFFDMDCTLCHVKGTRRKKAKDERKPMESKKSKLNTTSKNDPPQQSNLRQSQAEQEPA